MACTFKETNCTCYAGENVITLISWSYIKSLYRQLHAACIK